MKTQTSETLTELHDFVVTQAAEDAELDPAERLYQAELVKDVLNQESLQPKVVKGLVADYSAGVASHLETSQTAA